MVKQAAAVLKAFLAVALISQSFGCGTIMYPQRKGQRDGRIDPGVAVLDAIGLLFFIIPGVIAFAVDFTNGTIYLPGGAKSSLNDPGLRRIQFDPSKNDAASIERLVQKETGTTIRLDRGNVKISRINSLDELQSRMQSQ